MTDTYAPDATFDFDADETSEDVGTDNDSHDDHIDQPEHIEPAEPDEADHDGGARTKVSEAARRAGRDRAMVRRVTSKLVQLQGAGTGELDVLSGVLGTPADPVELTVAIMSGGKVNLSILADIAEIAELDPMQAGVAVMSKSRPAMRELHEVLSSLGAASAKSLHASDIKAATTLATDIQSLDAGARSVLQRVGELAKRTS